MGEEGAHFKTRNLSQGQILSESKYLYPQRPLRWDSLLVVVLLAAFPAISIHIDILQAYLRAHFGSDRDAQLNDFIGPWNLHTRALEPASHLRSSCAFHLFASPVLSDSSRNHVLSCVSNTVLLQRGHYHPYLDLRRQQTGRGLAADRRCSIVFLFSPASCPIALSVDTFAFVKKGANKTWFQFVRIYCILTVENWKVQ